VTVGAALATPAYAEVTIGNTHASLLKDGLQAFPSMLAAIAAAERTICFETYILRDDATGTKFAEALKERARNGVQVNLIFDGWGSSVSEQFLLDLALSGVRTLNFQPVRFFGRFGRVIARLKRRNHRKSLTVDGKVGFTGGLNISDDYSAIEHGGRGWRDTHVRLEGPPVIELERLFLETWRRYKGAPLEERRYAREKVPPAAVKILGNAFRADRKDIRKAYVNAMGTAQKNIYLTHAYFMPPSRIVKALMKAARGKVRVAVILAASTDVHLVLWAARGLYQRLLRAGVEVYEWEGRILHAKTAVVDGRWATVGSANLDSLSLRQNLEVNAVFEDPAFAEAVERMFVEDLAQCRRITREWLRERPIGERLLSWFAFQLRRWL
jgi:cardiolipin synthase A/B